MAEAEEYRCFVGGLAWATDDQSLGRAFSQFGDVVESKVINDRETGRSRGFGFVTFSSEQAMKDAIEGMNGQDLDGRSITVNEAQSRGSGGGSAVRVAVDTAEVVDTVAVVVVTAEDAVRVDMEAAAVDTPVAVIPTETGGIK